MIDIGNPYSKINNRPAHLRWRPYIQLPNKVNYDPYNPPITVDHPSSVIMLGQSIHNNILCLKEKYEYEDYKLIILDYLGTDASSGMTLAIARDPARQNAPITAKIAPSKVTFGRLYQARFSRDFIIDDLKEISLILPELDMNVDSVIDLLRDRGFGVSVSEKADNVFVPMLFSYAQNHGPHARTTGLRCGISLAAYDGLSRSYEELESVAKLLSPQNELNAIGEVEEHSVIIPSEINKIPEKASRAISAFRGTF